MAVLEKADLVQEGTNSQILCPVGMPEQELPFLQTVSSQLQPEVANA